MAGLAALCLILGGGEAAAAEPLAEVRVDGTERVEKEILLREIRSKPGEDLSEETVSEDLKRLYKLKYFDSVRAEVSDEGGGPVLTFRVKEKPLIKDHRVTGSSKVSKEKIDEVLKIKDRTFLDFEVVRRDVEAIKKLYEQEGYYLAEVVYELDHIPARNQVSVIYKALEGVKVQVRRINFVGNTTFPDEDLIVAMETKVASAFSWATDEGRYQKEIFQDDVEKVKAFYLNNGFIKVQVLDPIAQLSKNRRWIYLSMVVKEGPRYRIGRISFAGDLLFTPQELEAATETKPDLYFSRDRVSKDIFAITEKYGDLGYAFAEVEPITDVRDDDLKVDIEYRIKKGNKVYFNRINIVGNTTTRDKVVRREMKVAEGDLYSISRLRRSREKVYRLGFFEEVDFQSRRIPGMDLLDLDVKVKEGSTGTLQVTGGYSTFEGPIFMIQVQQANLLGYGHQLSTSASFGKRSKLFFFDYLNPYFLDSDWSLGFQAFRTQTRSFRGFVIQNTGGQVRLGYLIEEFTRLFAAYEYKISEVSDIPRTPFPFDGATSSVELSVRRSTKNHPFDPSGGSVQRLGAQTASRLLGSDFDFVKYDASSTWYVPVFLKIVFSTRLAGAYLQRVGEDPVPFFERFFAGGLGSVRGYNSQSLTPVQFVQGDREYPGDPSRRSEVAIGGNKLALINNEMVFPLIPPAGLKWVLFYDLGNVFEEGDVVDPLKFRQGWGFGIRWFSPIGPLRFEWGFPINRKRDEPSPVFEFFIGSIF
ncbi:MAG: outer membrane protein assembly factor BamA [Nitrospirae bacterium]|nr:outer membrane protein assembly factor BamA [Nitrospirota bacterium]